MWWYKLKEPIVDVLPFSRDSLHVDFGLVIFLGFALLLRRRRNGLLYAWAALLALQTVNETLDFVDWYRWTGTIPWSESANDFSHTMLWPTVLVLVRRWLDYRR